MWIESRPGETATIVVLIAAALLFDTVIVPLGVDVSSAVHGVGPRFILDFAAWSIILLGLGRLVRLWLLPGATDVPVAHADPAEPAEAPPGAADLWRIGVVFAICLIYATVLVDWLGFYIASMVMLVAMVLVLGERRIVLIAVYVLAVPLCIYALFEAGLNLRLPKNDLIELWLGR